MEEKGKRINRIGYAETEMVYAAKETRVEFRGVLEEEGEVTMMCCLSLDSNRMSEKFDL